MFSIILSAGWRVLSSRVGLAALIGVLLWGWHVYDKRQAVSAARAGYVREFELAAAKAELRSLRQRALAAQVANQSLQEKIQVAEGEAQRFAAELEAYARENRINPDGIVDPSLLGRLRAN